MQTRLEIFKYRCTVTSLICEGILNIDFFLFFNKWFHLSACWCLPRYCVKFYQLGIIPSFSSVINTSSCRIIKMSISSETDQNSFSFDPLVGRLNGEHVRCLALNHSQSSQPAPLFSPTSPSSTFVYTNTLQRLSAGSAQICFFNIPLLFGNVF